MGSKRVSGDALFDAGSTPHVLTLAERFTLPPFSVLSARAGWWTDRKRMWKELGLESGEGRDAQFLERKDYGDEMSAKLLSISNGVSIFDPVLAELSYRWYCPPGGRILDPFAGGSVRGIVAAFLGFHYTGVDLSGKQIDANYDQLAALEEGPDPIPGSAQWIEGDSLAILPSLPPASFDYVFSCPPYYDLERYSEDPSDISNMTWSDFLKAYREIIHLALKALAYDRFAGWVIGEVRDPKGAYRNLVGATVNAFRDSGAAYHSEAILVTSAGTLPLRAAKFFTTTRKLGNTHQTVQTYVKGSAKRAALALEPLPNVVADIEEEEQA